jgi:hypothetical protein
MPGVRVAVGAAIAGTGDAASRSDGLDVTDAPVNADGIDDDAGAPTFTPLVDGDRARVLFTVPHPTSSTQPLRHPTRIIQDIGVFNAPLGRALAENLTHDEWATPRGQASRFRSP